MRLGFQSRLIFLVISVSVFAVAKDNPYVGNHFDTLHFYAPAQRFAPSLSISPTLSRSLDESVGGQQFASVSYSGISTTIKAAYGIIDCLAISASEQHVVNLTANSTNTISNTTTTTQEHGFSNPTLDVSYRFWDNSAFFADVGLGFSPKLGTTVVVPNATILNPHAALAYVIGNHEFRVDMNAHILSSATYQSDTSSASYTDDARNYFDFSFRYRLHASDALFLEPGANFYFQQTINRTFPNSIPPAITVETEPFYCSPFLLIGYSITPKLIASASINYVKYNYSYVQADYAVTSYVNTLSNTYLNLAVAFLM